ncbi:MAG: response regulator transcription factor [Anaerolineales bacterium]
MIRLLIVDDHEVVRLGLRTLLESEPDLQVAAEAGNAQQALIQAESQRPDVVIMDIQLPGVSGLEACREIRRKFPQIQVVMLTSSVNEAFLLEALRAGAAGYVLKQVGSDELVRAIRAAQRGELALDPKSAAHVVARLNELQNKAEADAFRELSPREMEVLNLVAQGQNNREIGQALHLSEITARNYVTALLEKLQLRNRVELAAYAIRHHIEERL